MDEPQLDAYSPDLGDWRLYLAIWATGSNGTRFDQPKAMRLTSLFHNPGGSEVSFLTPSAAALHLSAAWKAAKRAAIIKGRMNMRLHTDVGGKTVAQVPDEETAYLFDYFEEMITVAIGSFGAVEAFCNQTIIEKASGPLIIKRKRRDESLQPEEAERQAFIDDKVKRIVPDLLGLKTPCNKPAWEAYVRVKGIRDRVTHFKRGDQSRSFDATAKPTALLELWKSDCYSMPEDAMAVLRYFQPSNKLLRWMVNPEWKRPETS